LKQAIAVVIICLIIMPSLAVISEKTQEDYTYEHIRFLCTDGDGFNEAKYQCYVQMYEQQKRESQSMSEIEPTITQESIHAQKISSDDGIIDSSWPMKCHDNKHSGRSPYNTADNNGAELWKFYTPGWIEGGAVIDNDGIIYFGSFDDYLYALNPDGTLKWKFDVNRWIWSTPAISEDGTIYVGSWDDYLYALNPNGTLKWRFNARDTISSSPAIANDGTIYFGIMGPDEFGRVFAINQDGSEKWHYDTNYWITSDPAIGDDGTIYIGSGDSHLYAINPDGTLRWTFDTDHYIKGPASIASDGTIYVGSYDDYLYALKPEGTMKWQIKIGTGTETNPSIGSDGTIFVGDDKLYAINPDGTYKWTFDLGTNSRIHQSSPAISADGIIYVGTNIGDSDGGEIIAINSDGTLRWRRTIAGYWLDSSPCIGENGIVYIGSAYGIDGGYLYAFGPGDVNNPPNKPAITGPNSGKTGESYSYSFSATDPDNDQISYYVDWGDGSNSGWQGPYQSGSNITLSHSWSNDGTYSIKAKAKDDEGSESTYATLKVTMPKSKTFSLLDRLIEMFPFTRYLFGGIV